MCVGGGGSGCGGGSLGGVRRARAEPSDGQGAAGAALAAAVGLGSGWEGERPKLRMWAAAALWAGSTVGVGGKHCAARAAAAWAAAVGRRRAAAAWAAAVGLCSMQRVQRGVQAAEGTVPSSGGAALHRQHLRQPRQRAGEAGLVVDSHLRVIGGQGMGANVGGRCVRKRGVAGVGAPHTLYTNTPNPNTPHQHFPILQLTITLLLLC